MPLEMSSFTELKMTFRNTVSDELQKKKWKPAQALEKEAKPHKLCSFRQCLRYNFDL